MADSVYRVTEVIGVSGESWDAARGRLGPDARSYPPASRAARSNSSKPWRMSCWL